MSWHPRLRTVLLIVNLLILLLPLAGIAALRLFETELIRSTQAQLIVQGAVVRDVYAQELARQALGAGIRPEELPGRKVLFVPPPAGASGTMGAFGTAAAPFEPIVPALDAGRSRLLPEAPDPAPAAAPADPVAAAAGARLTPALQASVASTLTGIRIVDAGGIVVASTRGEIGVSLMNRDEVVRGLQGEGASVLRERSRSETVPPLASISRGQRYRIFVVMPVIASGKVVGAVVLSRTPLDIVKALYLVRVRLLQGAAAVLLVVLLVTIVTSFTINRPLEALTRRAVSISRGDTALPAAPRGPATLEVARLSTAIDEMARTLEERAGYIRTFASHVSHEFKSPLTTIRGTVELLRDHLEEMSPSERARFLDNLEQASGRLELLVKRLLDLARADVVRPGEERTPAREALEEAARRRREAGFDVQVSCDPAVGAVRMGRETLEEIVLGLVDNAIQHGGDAVRIRIACRPAGAAGAPAVEVEVSDDGPGISAANVSRIFTPFFTTARDRGGSGLGLSIARSLLEAHGGSIHLVRTGPGAVFRLVLPS
jgi:signal transduction histidine kinase